MIVWEDDISKEHCRLVRTKHALICETRSYDSLGKEAWNKVYDVGLELDIIKNAIIHLLLTEKPS